MHKSTNDGSTRTSPYRIIVIATDLHARLTLDCVMELRDVIQVPWLPKVTRRHWLISFFWYWRGLIQLMFPNTIAVEKSCWWCAYCVVWYLLYLHCYYRGHQQIVRTVIELGLPENVRRQHHFTYHGILNIAWLEWIYTKTFTCSIAWGSAIILE